MVYQLVLVVPVYNNKSTHHTDTRPVSVTHFVSSFSLYSFQSINTGRTLGYVYSVYIILYC